MFVKFFLKKNSAVLYSASWCAFVALCLRAFGAIFISAKKKQGRAEEQKSGRAEKQSVDKKAHGTHGRLKISQVNEAVNNCAFQLCDY
jgi:hypothetical protein